MQPAKYRLPMNLGDLEPVCTLGEIAAELGVTRERARQIEARALYKLRVALAMRGYTVADFFDGVKTAPAPVRRTSAGTSTQPRHTGVK